MRFKSQLLARVMALHHLFAEGALTGPERHEVNPGLPLGSAENYLYFTLPCSVNFQRNSPAMWASALSTYLDPQTSYVFRPSKVAATSRANVLRSLTKYRLALQTNRHTDIWVGLCRTLAERYGSNPRNILAEYGYDVVQVVAALQRDKDGLFPALRGRKLSNYWLFILTQFTDAPLRNTDHISIIPDTHVLKSTIRLGLADSGVTPERVETIWREVLKEVSLSPVEMHTALWRWSRNGFQPRLP